MIGVAVSSSTVLIRKRPSGATFVLPIPLPVGDFIEECYWKRVGGNTRDNAPREPKPTSIEPSTPREDAAGALRDPAVRGVVSLTGEPVRTTIHDVWEESDR